MGSMRKKITQFIEHYQILKYLHSFYMILQLIRLGKST